MKRKPVVLIDMDDTSADFCRHPVFTGMIVNDHNCTAMYEPGFFLSLQPVDGALKAIRQIIRMGYDVQIATQPVAESPHCYAEKIKWLGMWFPELVSKVNMVQDKGILKADYLIDDRADKWKEKFEANGGKFIHFRYNSPWSHNGTTGTNAREWQRIVKFLEDEKNQEQNQIDRVTHARREDFE